MFAAYLIHFTIATNPYGSGERNSKLVILFLPGTQGIVEYKNKISPDGTQPPTPSPYQKNEEEF